MTREEFVDLVGNAYRAAVAELGSTRIEAVTEMTALIGPDSLLDSIALVSLVLDVEQRLDEQAGLKVRLMDEAALSRKRSPFRTVGSMADYLTELTETQAPT